MRKKEEGWLTSLLQTDNPLKIASEKSIAMSNSETYQQPVYPDEAYYRQQQRMRQSRRWGGILLVIGIIWLMFELIGRGVLWSINTGMVEHTQTVQQTVSASVLQIKVTNDRVTIVPSEHNAIQIEATKHVSGWNRATADRALEDLRLEVQQQGDTASITIARPKHMLAVGRSPSIDLRIALPPDTQFSIESINGDLKVTNVTGTGRMQTVTGDITVQQMRGALTLKTTSGEINLREHQGTVQIEAISGDVRLTDSAVADVTASTFSGDLKLTGVTGLLQLNTISGDITIKQAHNAQLIIDSTSGDITFTGSLIDNQPHRVSTISGNVELRLPSHSNLELAVNTLSGDIETTLDLRNIERDRRTLTGIAGTGGATLSINTTSGDVSIKTERVAR